MKNKELRCQILQDGTFSQFKADRKTRYLNNNIDEFNLMIQGNELLKECERIRKCRYEQIKKIKRHIEFWINKAQRSNYSLYFATFTFSDDALLLKSYTRKKHIISLISKRCNDYIINIDYGKNTEREHYHAILIFNSDNVHEYDKDNHLKISEIDEYRFGNYDIRKIRLDNVSAEKLANYLVKLVLHSVKVKQQYISTKKGSLYQKYLQLTDELDKIQKNIGLRIRTKRLTEIYNQLNEILYENNLTLIRLKNVFGNDFEIIER